MFRFDTRFEAGLWLVGVMAVSIVAGHARGEEKPKAPRLEFRILANGVDEPKAIEAAKKVFVSAKKDEKLKKELERLAKEGKPPMPPALGTDKAPGYSWVEMGPAALRSFSLDEESAKDDELNREWKAANAARAKGEALTLRWQEGCLLFSRPCLDTNLSKEARDRKKFDYFLLTRDPQKGKALTGKHLVSAKLEKDRGRGESYREILIEFGKEGGDIFFELTTANRPSDRFNRHLAIIVKGKVVSTPGLREPIKSKAMISGGFTAEEAKELVEGLRQDIAGKKK